MERMISELDNCHVMSSACAKNNQTEYLKMKIITVN